MPRKNINDTTLIGVNYRLRKKKKKGLNLILGVYWLLVNDFFFFFFFFFGWGGVMLYTDTEYIFRDSMKGSR